MDVRYSYIILFILPIFIPLLVVFIRRKDLRRIIIVKGLLGGVLGLAADWVLIEGGYWEPYTFFGHGVVSAESFISGFCTVAFISVCYLFISGRPARTIEWYQYPRFLIRLALRLLAFIIGGLITLFLLRLFFGLDVIIIIAALISVLAISSLVQLRTKALIKKYLAHMAMVTAILLCLTVVAYLIGHVLFPNYWYEVLTMDAQWNIMILGFMPVSELLYWTVIMGGLYFEFGEPPGRFIA